MAGVHIEDSALYGSILPKNTHGTNSKDTIKERKNSPSATPPNDSYIVSTFPEVPSAGLLDGLGLKWAMRVSWVFTSCLSKGSGSQCSVPGSTVM